MLEQLVVWLGRNVKIRGSDRALSTLFPCNHNTHRYVRGVRARVDGLLMELDSRNWIDWNLLFRGEYEPQLTRLLSRLAPPGGVAVDIGANIGTHTLTLAQAVGQKGSVLAFEPNPPVRAVLGRNVALNKLNNVRVFGCALGEKPGMLPLRVPKADSAEYSNMGLASLVALETPHDLVDVPVCTLDEVFGESGLNRLDVVKIDVQGYECQVLAGMSGILERNRPAVIFEYELWAWGKAGSSLSDAMKLLNAAGYRLWRFVGATPTSIVPLHDARSLPDHSDLIAFRHDDPRPRMLGFILDCIESQSSCRYVNHA